MVFRTLLLVAVLSAPAAIDLFSQIRSAIELPPPNPHIDKGACPFECCTYREWVANQEITLVENPNGKKVAARVAKGEKVQGLTGEVHSTPLRVVTQHDHPEAKIKRGDVIYVLHYMGEGYWKAWHNGQLVDVENFSEDGPFPKYTWWVKVKTKSGIVGWTISHGNFSNQDACGG